MSTNIEPEDLAREGDLLCEILDRIEYDFCEDDDGVQGNWKVTRDGFRVTVEYIPHDVSPYLAQTMHYLIERLPNEIVDRCDPSRGHHSDPHRGCILR